MFTIAFLIFFSFKSRRVLPEFSRRIEKVGCVCCTEVSKTIDMYAFLFNDILLLTKIKKPPRKVCGIYRI